MYHLRPQWQACSSVRYVGSNFGDQNLSTNRSRRHQLYFNTANSPQNKRKTILVDR